MQTNEDFETGARDRWVGVGLDSRIEPASSHPVIVDGRELALWRGESGPAPVWYHACCGGTLSSPQQAWGKKTYLSGKSFLDSIDGEDLCRQAPNYRWQFYAGGPEIEKLQNVFFPRSQFGELLSFGVKSRYPSGHVRDIMVRGTQGELVLDGEYFRLKMQKIWGVNSIKSAHFTVRPLKDQFLFEGRGFGHGVGMCQHGALTLGKMGWKYEDILEFYFPGTHLWRTAEGD